MADKEENKMTENQAKRRFWLSLIIIIASVGLLILLFFLFLDDDDGGLEPQTIFTAMVGLVGTWVGTILAFYYSKDNFEAASRSTQEMVDRMTKNKLDSILAKEAMLGINKVNILTLEEGKKYLLKDLVEDDKYLKKYNRLPVLAPDFSPVYIVYRSIVDKYISSIALKGGDTTKLTLDDMAKDHTYNRYLVAFVPVKPDDPLSTVKTLMERTVIDNEVYVADAFVTEQGTNKSPVQGWITNVDINKRSRV